MKKVLASILGGLTVLAPIGAGLAVILDPLRRKVKEAGLAVKVTTLNLLPEDGVPRKFPVISSRVDAWNKSAASPIGAVYLRRQAGEQIKALNVVCPHAGCFVDFAAAKNSYLCPCHNSMFDLEGGINDANSPAPRGLDELAVEIRKGNEVWVKFQNYRAGVAERIPA